MGEARELFDADVEDARVLWVREEYRRGAVGERRLEGFEVRIASSSGWIIVTLYPLTMGTAQSAGCEKSVVMISSRFSSSPLSRQ